MWQSSYKCALQLWDKLLKFFLMVKATCLCRHSLVSQLVTDEFNCTKQGVCMCVHAWEQTWIHVHIFKSMHSYILNHSSSLINLFVDIFSGPLKTAWFVNSRHFANRYMCRCVHVYFRVCMIGEFFNSQRFVFQQAPVNWFDDAFALAM